MDLQAMNISIGFMIITSVIFLLGLAKLIVAAKYGSFIRRKK
jgi:hypothetical protein